MRTGRATLQRRRLRSVGFGNRGRFEIRCKSRGARHMRASTGKAAAVDVAELLDRIRDARAALEDDDGLEADSILAELEDALAWAERR